MAKSGLKHIDVGAELSKTEWESEESHELVHGNGFPSSPVERQLFYRDDEHKWYIYNGSEWVWLGGGGGGGTGDMLKSVYDTDDDGVVDNSEKLEGSTKAQVQDHDPKAHKTSHENGGGDEISVAGLSGELADGQKVKLDHINKTHLSQDFGASATRLRNIIATPIAGEIMRIMNIKSGSPFSAKINGNPTATSVVYDGDSNEGMFDGLYSGADYWGRIILHNITRGNSRKIVDVDVATKTITTESSTDDWADNDDITVQSQTNTYSGFFDVDVSDQVPATTEAIYLFVASDDQSDTYSNQRAVYFHPYETYDAGKRQWVSPKSPLQSDTVLLLIKIIDQKFTAMFWSGCTDVSLVTAVKASVEYADT